MRLLHIITSLRTGGAEKLMVDLLPRLKKSGLDVDLLLLDGSDTPFKEELIKAGIHVMDLGIGGSVYSPLKFLRVIPIIRRYDIVHTHNTASQLFGALASMLCSVVLCTTEHTTSNRRRDWKWYVPIDRWMYSRYDNVICISTDTKKNLMGHIPNFPSKLSIIYNGVDVEKINICKKGNLEKEKYGCRIALIQVAGFRYQKDQDTVIKALKLLPDDCHLFLIGDGERREQLEDLVNNFYLKSRVHFLGIRTDVGSLLKDADIVVMSSHWEGFGLAAVEGMAAGKPVIASDVLGLAEVVKDAGILFETGNYKDLSEKISTIMNDSDLYQIISKKCQERANEFRIEHMAEGYKRVYLNLLAR